MLCNIWDILTWKNSHCLSEFPVSSVEILPGKQNQNAKITVIVLVTQKEEIN